MLFGFDVSSMSAWIGSDQYLEYFDHPDSNRQGGITASMSAGSFIGSLAAGYLCDRVGRRGVLKIASVIWVIGAALQCSAQNVAHLIVGRIVSGLASKSLYSITVFHIRLQLLTSIALCSWHNLVPSLCLPRRTRPCRHPRPCRRNTAVGHRLGHFDHVPHLVRLLNLHQWSLGLSNRLGHSGRPRYHPRYIALLLPRVTSLARKQRSLG